MDKDIEFLKVNHKAIYNRIAGYCNTSRLASFCTCRFRFLCGIIKIRGSHDTMTINSKDFAKFKLGM